MPHLTEYFYGVRLCITKKMRGLVFLLIGHQGANAFTEAGDAAVQGFEKAMETLRELAG